MGSPLAPILRTALEFLSDNGVEYIAAETHAFARALRPKLSTLPSAVRRAKGIADSFVNTFKRDYVARMDCAGATAGGGV